MAKADLTAAASYLKERFTPKRMENLSLGAGALLGMIPKDESYGGEDLKIPLAYADIKGTSHTFSVAQANKDSSDTVAFAITLIKDYGLFSVDGQLIRQSKGNLNAWLPGLEREAESAAKALIRRTAHKIYRTTSGSIGVINSTVTGTTLTLSNRADIAMFEPGMKVYFANPTGPALRDSGETVTISSVNRSAGSMVVTPSLSTISGLTAADLIIQEGDISLSCAGVLSWVPTSAPSATSFFGVDRSVDDRLGGLRYDATGRNIVEALNNAAAFGAEQDAPFDKCFMNIQSWRDLGNYLGSDKVRIDGAPWSRDGEGAKASIAYPGYRIIGPLGPIDVFADRWCPVGNAFLMSMSSWTLHSTGPVPQCIEEDGNMILREATDDAYEGRWGAFYNVSCNAPGHNLVIYNL